MRHTQQADGLQPGPATVAPQRGTPSGSSCKGDEELTTKRCPSSPVETILSENAIDRRGARPHTTGG
jgi:hypothetical protein